MARRYLDLADYLLIAEAILGVKAERLAEMPRVANLAASALAVPRSGWEGRDAYPLLEQKAALLVSRLVRNHPLPDGNKRVAWLALIEFLERNDHELCPVDEDDAVATIFGLAAGRLSESALVDWVRPRIRPGAHSG